MTYSTKQLTQALQQLTSRSQEGNATDRTFRTRVISADQLHFSKEVEKFLEQKQQYAQQTRDVSVGSY